MGVWIALHFIPWCWLFRQSRKGYICLFVRLIVLVDIIPRVFHICTVITMWGCGEELAHDGREMRLATWRCVDIGQYSTTIACSIAGVIHGQEQVGTLQIECSELEVGIDGEKNRS